MDVSGLSNKRAAPNDETQQTSSTPAAGVPSAPPFKKINTTGSLEAVAQEIAAARKSAVELSALPDKPESGETMELDNFAAVREKELLAEVELKRKIRMTPVSTDDQEVRKQLRGFGEPITLFGEGPAERRVRLRELIALRDDEKFKKPDLPTMPAPKSDDASRESGSSQIDAKTASETNKTWYHEGPVALRTARLWIAEFSLPRAEERLKSQRKLRQEGDALKSWRAMLQEQQSTIRTLSNSHSQVGDTRPLTHCTFSPNGKMIGTASWTGLCKLWNSETCEEIRVLRGHNINMSCLEFHPHATLSMPDTAYGCMASSDHAGVVNLWSLASETPSATLSGHNSRVAKLSFHPSGRFLATCCYDSSWRLWDLNKQEELLFQEGHTRPVYDISFQCDGSVCATVSLDCFGRVWDLRTGRCIMIMDGHQRPVYSVDFSPNGHEMITGSEDNSVKVWDLRSRRCNYTIPAHTSIVTRVKFEPNRGHYIASASFDSTVKVWSHPNWTPLITLKGHESKVTCLDISRNSSTLLTCSFDRTFKLWNPE
ncbi:uncharacterized protein LOC142337920 [Convolutriloba macropyga]|uniref:uncharacterized protein LOC142337920 n=1 Tax=Convolutriloba macropyga TaxID=536237 RepID=UPI003F51F404